MSGEQQEGSAAFSNFATVPIEITVSVGKARPSIRDLMALKENSIIPLDKTINDTVDIFAGSKLIARGELVDSDGGGSLSVRVTEIIEINEII